MSMQLLLHSPSKVVFSTSTEEETGRIWNHRIKINDAEGNSIVIFLDNASQAQAIIEEAQEALFALVPADPLCPDCGRPGIPQSGGTYLCPEGCQGEGA